MLPLLPVPFLGWSLSSYRTAYATTALFVLTTGARWTAVRGGFGVRASRRASAALLLVALIGGRAHYVAANAHAFAGHWADALVFWGGGRHVGGVLLALVLVGPLLLRRLGLRAGQYADAGVPTFTVAMAIARLGCFLHGCCSGVAARWPWCVTYPRWTAIHARQVSLGLIAADAPRTAPVHPLPLYFAAASLLVGAVAVRLHARKRYHWQVTLVSLVGYSVVAALLESFRDDYAGRVWWGPLPQLTWVALATAVGGAVVLAGVEVCRAACRPRPLPA